MMLSMMERIMHIDEDGINRGDNALRDRHDSSDHMKAEYNNCFHRLFKIFPTKRK